NSMEENTSYPLIIYTSEDGDNSIKIDELVNISLEQDIFLHDIELDYYHDFKKGHFEFFLNAGYYDNRFEIVFHNPNASLSTDDVNLNEDKLDVRYANNIDKLVLINPHGLQVNDIQLFNILGQHVLSIEDIKSDNLSQYNVGNLNPGTYIIKLNTVSGSVSKKVLIN
ncbi:putative secreted protein (Por secretion system target), partial [Winogradskyella wandonensis]